MDRNTIEEMISNAADSAADEAVNYLNTRTSSSRNQEPVNKGYFSHKFIGLDEGAKKALAKAYLIRQEPFTDERWIDAYADWLTATGKKYHDKHDGLKDFKTMAAYYWTRIKSGKGDMVKKEYGDIKASVANSIRRFTDANFE